MKLNKFFLIGAIALGMVACNKNEEAVTPSVGGNTYVGVRIAFPGAQGTTRALPEEHNPNGEWKGRDAIEKITVFVVNTTSGTVDYTTFGKDQFNGITTDGFLKPNLAVKATAGHNLKAYAVVNDLSDKTVTALKKIGAAQFDNEFKGLVNEVVNIGEVSKFITADKKDVVMMTNADAAAEITSVEAGVTAADAIAGTKNQAKITVSRVVSRGIVTIGTGVQAAGIKVKNANGQEISTLTLKSITYGVGQSNKKFFNMHKTDWTTPEPVYSFVPATAADWTGANADNFDYTGLTEMKNLQTITDKTNPNVVTALGAEEFNKFVLPVTHATGNFRKGNTTYFEIKATFVPDAIDGTSTTSTTAPATVFLGLNDGKFYSTRTLAEAVGGQKATEYKDGVMKYVLWLNPNKPYGGTEKITESPTVRNQIYHAHITGFKEIGVPNNPLNPEDPNNPENPDNPIDPEDPLQTEDTYMSVSITVLPWGIHSYDVDLGNEY